MATPYFHLIWTVRVCLGESESIEAAMRSATATALGDTPPSTSCWARMRSEDLVMGVLLLLWLWFNEVSWRSSGLVPGWEAFYGRPA